MFVRTTCGWLNARTGNCFAAIIGKECYKASKVLTWNYCHEKYGLRAPRANVIHIHPESLICKHRLRSAVMRCDDRELPERSDLASCVSR